MAKALIKAIMKVVSKIIDIILLPVNSLIVGIFPNFASALSHFNNFVTTYVGGGISFFSSILPPITRSIILLWLGFLIVYYGVSWSYTAIIKIYNVIRRIKFW